MDNVFFINWPNLWKLIFRVCIYTNVSKLYIHGSRKKIVDLKNGLQIFFWRFIEAN